MIAQTLKNYLERNDVPFEVIEHRPTYAAQYTAAVTHTPGRDLAKVTMIKMDDTMAMAVLPASQRVDFHSLKNALPMESGTIELAEEHEFVHLFGDCDLGAMPPFGNLYGLKVYVADDLADEEFIGFNAGTHTELIRMRYRDFDRLVQPTILHFSAPMTV